MKKVGVIVLVLIAVSILIWLFFSDKGKSITGLGRKYDSNAPVEKPTQHTPVNPISRPVTRIQNNAEGTALVQITTYADGSSSSKTLTFDDAIKLLGTAGNVCGKVKYPQCSSIRMS